LSGPNNLAKLRRVADVTAGDCAGRIGEWEELEVSVAAVVAGEVPAAGGGKAEARVAGFMTEEDDPGRSRLPAGTWIGEWGVYSQFRFRGARGTYFCQAAAFGQAGADEGGAEAFYWNCGTVAAIFQPPLTVIAPCHRPLSPPPTFHVHNITGPCSIATVSNVSCDQPLLY
jgi:hypothetical protein